MLLDRLDEPLLAFTEVVDLKGRIDDADVTVAFFDHLFNDLIGTVTIINGDKIKVLRIKYRI